MNGSQAAQTGNRRTAVKTPRYLGVRFLIALIAGGVLYSVAFVLSGHVPFMRLLVEQAGDTRMQFWSDYKAPPARTTPVLFLDIDQKSYAQLGRPIITPRNLLATMLEKVAAGKPKLIILDIDPTWPWHADDEGTQRLADTLARLGRGPTPILLYRTPMAPMEENGATYFRPSPKLDPVVAESPLIMWVSSGAEASADGVVRRAPLWIRGCLGEKPVRYANSALAGWAILEEKRYTPETVMKRLSNELKETGRFCKDDKPVAKQRTGSVMLTIGKQKKNIGNDWATGTITYSMSANPGKERQRNPEALVELSARPFIDTFTKASQGISPQDISTDIFRNHAVIIGVSAHDLRDIHLTPLGKMPGALVIANQLRSLQEFGPGSGPNYCSGLLITEVLCVVTFLAWLGFRRIAPVTPYFIEQLYSLMIGFIIWVILSALASSAAAPLYPLQQYLVILVLFTLEDLKGFKHWGFHSYNAR